MKFFYLIFPVAFFCPTILNGQPKWKLENLHGSVGVGIGGNSDFSWQDLKNQSRSPFFPDHNSSDMKPDNGLFDIRITQIAGASIKAGFYPYSKKRNSYNARKEWQVGIFYEYVQIPGGRFTNSSHYSYWTAADTLRQLYMNYNISRQYLGVSNSITFRANPESRLNIFGGAELNIGLGISGRINTYADRQTSVRTDSGYYRMISDGKLSYHYHTRSAILTSLQLFGGIGVRFLHHYYFSIKAGFDLGPAFYPHVSGTGWVLLFESADLSIPLENKKKNNNVTFFQ